jgi:hypothetical protein
MLPREIEDLRDGSIGFSWICTLLVIAQFIFSETPIVVSLLHLEIDTVAVSPENRDIVFELHDRRI